MVDGDQIRKLAREVLAEDVGSGDLTADLIDSSRMASAHIVCRAPAVICGRPWFEQVFELLDERVEIAWSVDEAASVEPGTVICQLSGPARALLTGERAALNLLQTLSGTATRTHSFVEAIAGTGAQILDTRKTLPGLRQAQKYAVACGGGSNHRMGLFDAILIKENHIALAGSITAAVLKARALHPGIAVEVETEHLGELNEALALGVEWIMLDNYSLADMREAVRRASGKATLEVSGNVDLGSIRQLAETGIDYISAGTLTKDVDAVDLSMSLRPL